MEKSTKRIKSSQESNKIIHDKKSLERSFKIGELIVIWIHTATNKLNMKWRGPYRIIRVEKSHLTVESLKDSTIRRVIKDHVKHYNSPTILPFRKNDELIRKYIADPNLEQSESEESDIDETNDVDDMDEEIEEEKQNEDKEPLYKYYKDRNLEQSDEEI